jgi:thiol-disulfide isomerase/thioredoxin
MTAAGLVRAVSLAALAAFAGPATAAEGHLRLAGPAAIRAEIDRHRGKVVVLNLWATWCTPCLREIPDLMQLEREFAGRGVALVALGMDDPAELAAVEAFRARHFAAFRSLLRDTPDMDTAVSVVDPAWNELLPTTYLIGRDGSVATRIQGKRTLEQFRAEIEPLLR